MKKTLILLAFLAAACTGPVRETRVTEPADYVSTLVGTQSDFTLSTGNTYPAIALPWGMNFWTPQTGKNGDGWAYTYDAHHIPMTPTTSAASSRRTSPRRGSTTTRPSR